MTLSQYLRLIGNQKEARLLLRAAAFFQTGDILTRQGMIFERIASSFKPGPTFDLDISDLAAKYGHL